ncbi:Catabolite control protein A [Arthrobacter sp. SO5]|nr:Catabolite control protein A [Arthrobacter sp. SO5]
MLQAKTPLAGLSRRPYAIFAGCNDTAFGSLMALQDPGLSAPEIVSIIGIDGHQMIGSKG